MAFLASGSEHTMTVSARAILSWRMRVSPLACYLASDSGGAGKRPRVAAKTKLSPSISGKAHAEGLHFSAFNFSKHHRTL